MAGSHKWWSGLAGALVLGGLLWLLWPQPASVELGGVDRGPVTVTVDEIAETRSRDRYVVSAPVSGRLHRIELREGDPVAVGQILARIDPAPLDERERAAREAQLASAQAMQAAAEQLAEHAEQDLALLQRERQRLENLLSRGLVATQSVDEARVAESTAANDAKAARFRLQAAAGDVRQARAGLLDAGSGAGSKIVALRAPVGSNVLRIPDRSERVVATGTTVMVLGDVTHLEVLIELLSTEAVRVKTGMPVMLDGWGGGSTLAARVTRVEPYAFTKVSALGVEEKRVNVLAALDQPPPQLGDGYRLTAHIVTAQTGDVTRAPSGAVFRCGESWCAYAATGGRAVLRHLEIGVRNADYAEVRTGLAAGEQVILYPSNTIADGSRVRARVPR